MAARMSMNDVRRRRLLLVGACLGLHDAAASAAAAVGALAAPLQLPATLTPRAPRAVMSGVSRAGDRLVAVGERGLIVLSDDGGRQWRQAQAPVSVTLTAVTFVDAKRGWAVGHAGVVLHSDDAGEHWVVQSDGLALAKAALARAEALPESLGDRRARRLQAAQRLVADGADKPLLGVCFVDAQRGMVVGAYGLAAITNNGGKLWEPCDDRLSNAGGMHLYGVAARGSQWVVVGEQGLLRSSADDAQTFDVVASPFKRSFFTVRATHEGAFLLGGLLGNVCRMEPDGSTVRESRLPAPFTVLSSMELANGQLVLVEQGGRLLVSRDGGRSFVEQSLPGRVPMTALALTADGGLVAAGMAGVSRLSVDLQALMPGPK